jgi:hypothetical protein
MPFTVTAFRGYDDQLMLIFLRAADQAAVSAASNRIDYLLKHFPEIRDADASGLRHISVGPLSVSYRFSPDDCKVEITELRYTETPPPDMI